MRRHHGRILVAFALAVAATGTARAAGRWENHLDPSAITGIVERGGRLHMSTLGGLLLYDVAANRFTQLDNSDGLTSNALTSLAFDPTGAIYIGTADIGIVKVRITADGLQRLRTFNEEIDGLSDNRIESVAWWKDELVYGAQVGMGIIRNDFAARSWFMRDGLPADGVRDVLPVGDFVWAATDSGVVVLDEFGFLRDVPGTPPEANVIGSDGATIWVGTDTGVRRFDPADSSWTDLGLPTRAMYSFFYDGADMWGADRFILFRYLGTGQNWATARVDSLVGRHALTGAALRARGLFVDGGGVAYMGSGDPVERRGLYLLRYDGVQFQQLIPSAPAANRIDRLSIDVDGSLWASFNSYYVGKLMPDGRWVNYNSSIAASDSLSSQYTNITCLADSRGIKWFCTLSSPASPRPLDRLDDMRDADYSNDVWAHYLIGSGGGDGLGSLNLQRAVEDPAGNIWFLSDDSQAGWSGLQILRADESEWFQDTPSVEPGMPSGNVIDAVFAFGEAYVAFRNYGVRVFAHGGYGWATLTNRPAHSWRDKVIIGTGGIQGGAQIRSMALSADGVLWIGTDLGLYRSDGTGALDQIGPYLGFSAGLLSATVHDVALDHEGNAWVATSSGLNRVARDDVFDIEAYSTPAEYARVLAALQYPLDTVTPLVDAQCFVLAVHPTRDLLYVGTAGGLSVLDISPPDEGPTDLTRVYVYPNPVNNRLGHHDLKIANLTSAVSVEIYNIEGELVHSQEAAADGDSIWDLLTAEGFVAASGVYLVRIRTSDGAVVKRVSVIR